MTLQLLHSEFSYIWGKLDFLFYQFRYCIKSDLNHSIPVLFLREIIFMVTLRSTENNNHFFSSIKGTVIYLQFFKTTLDIPYYWRIFWRKRVTTCVKLTKEYEKIILVKSYYVCMVSMFPLYPFLNKCGVAFKKNFSRKTFFLSPPLCLCI